MSTGDDAEWRAARAQLSAAWREMAEVVAGPDATAAEIEAAILGLHPLFVDMLRAEMTAVIAARHASPPPTPHRRRSRRR
jgi:hypothetical protein